MDVRSLRARLGLDSGYLSRLLRSLEKEGLVTVTPDEVDGRVRMVRHTDAGRAEFLVMEGLSDELAWSMLDPLGPDDRQADWSTPWPPSTACSARPGDHRPRGPAQPGRRRLPAGLLRRDRRALRDSGFDFDAAEPFAVDDMVEPEGRCSWPASASEPVGCGALHFFPDGVADVKRMWVDPTARGLGLGRRMLVELETVALAHGVSLLRLETNRSLVEAIALYRSLGYDEVDPFNDEVHAHHWFAKPLH